MNILLSASRTAALQAECNAFNAARPDEPPVGLEAYCQLQLESRADAAARQFGTIKVYQFVKRFTTAEYSAAVELAKTDEKVAGYFKVLEQKDEVRLFSETVTAGLTYLEQKKVLAPGRAAEITAIGA